MKKYLGFILLACLFLLGFTIRGKCPTMQTGKTALVQLSNTGETIVQVIYPCQAASVPNLVASPTGVGSGNAWRFEVNGLTTEYGGIVVYGEPNTWVQFTWISLEP